jgi:hypothetical protein
MARFLPPSKTSVRESNPDRAEVARQKWHVVLKTVPREGLDIRKKS